MCNKINTAKRASSSRIPLRILPMRNLNRQRIQPSKLSTRYDFRITIMFTMFTKQWVTVSSSKPILMSAAAIFTRRLIHGSPEILIVFRWIYPKAQSREFTIELLHVSLKIFKIFIQRLSYTMTVFFSTFIIQSLHSLTRSEWQTRLSVGVQRELHHLRPGEGWEGN